MHTEIQVMNAVRVVRISDVEVQMQWASNTSNDMIADSALVVLLGIDTSPATVKRKSLQRARWAAPTEFGTSTDISHLQSPPTRAPRPLERRRVRL